MSDEKVREFDIYGSDSVVHACENKIEWTEGCGWAKPDLKAIDKSAYSSLMLEAQKLRKALEYYDGVHRLMWAIRFEDLPQVAYEAITDFDKKYPQANEKE